MPHKSQNLAVLSHRNSHSRLQRTLSNCYKYGAIENTRRGGDLGYGLSKDPVGAWVGKGSGRGLLRSSAGVGTITASILTLHYDMLYYLDIEAHRYTSLSLRQGRCRLF